MRLIIAEHSLDHVGANPEVLKRMLEMTERPAEECAYHYPIEFDPENPSDCKFEFVTTNKDISLSLARMAEEPKYLNALAFLMHTQLNRLGLKSAMFKLKEDDDRSWMVTRTIEENTEFEEGQPTHFVSLIVSRN